MVTKSQHIIPASRGLCTIRVGGPHIRGPLSNNVVKRHLVLDHLLDSLRTCDVRQRVVTPCVTGDLVALGNHPLNQIWIWCRGIYFSLSIIVTGHEKRSSKVVRLEGIQKLSGVEVWPIIVC